MKKNKFKRVLSIALATVMVAGTIAFTPQGISEVQAASATVKNINLGTAGFSKPTSTGNENTQWAGSKVYYGNKLWRVLDPIHDSNGTEGSAFLFSEGLQGTKAYNDVYKTITWENCTLRNYLNGSNNSGGTGTFLGDTFTAKEQSAIKTTTVKNPNNSDYSTNGGNSTQDKLFLLSLGEVKNANYGFGSNSTRAASSWWWLRSPGYIVDTAAFVLDDGYVISHGDSVNFGFGSVRPAFNLNLSSVLFSSASSAGKSSFASVGTDQVSTNTWKLTLKDDSKTVCVTSAKLVSQSGQTVTVPYTYTGNDVSQISIMITDKAYTESDASILCYGALTATNVATNQTGTGTFTLPTGLPDGYKIYMMAEDVNDATLTDYSSTPVEINPTPGNCVIITNPEESHITLLTAQGNGSATQTGLTGAMADVSYTADNGYCFPSNYSVASQNGIDVTRIDDSTIKVSGTPTANTTITLEPASQKTYTITSDIEDKDFGTKNAGYTQPSAQTVTITNTGNQSVTISKNALTNYTVSDFSKTTLAANETATFTVKPNANLAAGTYNETIAVSTANSTSVSIPVKFKVNGAFSVTMNPSSSTIIDGESQTLTATPVGGSGSYTYKWYKGSEITPISGETSASINVSPSATTTYKVVVNDNIEDTEVTATITVNPMTYTVTYDKNGGSGVMTAGTATKDTAFTLPSCGFTAPEGKQFKNWAIGSVSGTTVAAGATYTFTGATTVYAIWENIPVEGPTIVGDNGTTGWDAIKDKTENATAGSTITVDMNGTTKVPGAVIDSIKGKDVDVVFDLGNGIKWTVNGKSVTKDDIGEIDFGVTTGTNTIPVDVVNEVTGEKYSIQISLAYNGEFGFTATLSISMDAKNAGYYANLYYYNKSTGKLEFMNAGKIDKNGNVDLTFTHASDYTIVVSDKAMNETDTSTPETPSTTPTETESAKTGDHSPILLWVIVMMASGIGITVASRKRKKAIR